MERVIEGIAALILHLRGESLNTQTRCFYCGQEHRTVDCSSPQRLLFFMKLSALAVDSQAEEETFHEGEPWEANDNTVAADDDDFLRETFASFFESELE